VPESYVHRIGRTARAGAEGVAISLCGREERTLLRDIERLTRQSIVSVNRCESAAGVEASNNGQGRVERRNRPPAQFRHTRNGKGQAVSNSKQRRHRGAAIAR
jgi:ATP-dependent RNA helicase RhlE